MIKDLKKKSLINSLVGTILIFVIGVFLIFACMDEIECLLFGYTDFSTLGVDDIKSGMYVSVDLEENYGSFATRSVEDSDTGIETITDYYYLILAGNDESGYKYMAIEVDSSDSARMDRMAEQTANGTTASTFTVIGKVCSMPSESFGIEWYFKNALKNFGYTSEEIDDVALKYYISVSDSEITWGESIFNPLFIMGIAAIIWGIVRIIKALTGAYLKKFMKVVNATGIHPDSIDEDYQTAETIGKNKRMKVGRLFTYYDLNTTAPKAVFNANISWIYQTIIQHKRYGIKVGKTYSMCVRSEKSEKGKAISIPFKNEKETQEAIQYFVERFPWIIAGYTPEISDLYENHRPQFLDIKYNKYPRN